MSDCPKCGAKLETPLGCGSCGVLFSPDREPTPFEVFGLEPAYALDAKELKRRLLRFSRLLHPDYFGAADAATRALAERNTATLNQAHELLAQPSERADWLVRWLGGPSEGEQRAMPKSFLLEGLEWNETLEATRAGPHGERERAQLRELDSVLRRQRESVSSEIARLLDPLPARGSAALTEARSQLNALRYLDNTLRQIEALRLDQATHRP